MVKRRHVEDVLSGSIKVHVASKCLFFAFEQVSNEQCYVETVKGIKNSQTKNQLKKRAAGVFSGTRNRELD